MVGRFRVFNSVLAEIRVLSPRLTLDVPTAGNLRAHGRFVLVDLFVSILRVKFSIEKRGSCV